MPDWLAGAGSDLALSRCGQRACRLTLQKQGAKADIRAVDLACSEKVRAPHVNSDFDQPAQITS